MRFKILLSLILIVIINFANAQDLNSDKNEKIIQYENIAEIVQEGDYIFIANKAISQNGKLVNLSPESNMFIISDNVASAVLPFYGEFYKENSTSDKTLIKFKDVVSDYKIKLKENKFRIQIKFRVKTSQDLFNCSLKISHNGDAELTINCHERSTISYTGNVGVLVQ